MSERERPKVELMHDVSAADWVVAGLEPPGGRPGPYRLECFLPAGFEAYARVFHPSYDGSSMTMPRPRTWAEIGAERGVALRPDVTFDEVVGVDSQGEGDLRGFYDLAPEEGRLLETTCDDLIAVLVRHTRTPERCWFGVWTGAVDAPRGVPNTSPGPTRSDIRRQRRAQRRRDRQRWKIPTFTVLNAHALFLGPIAAACSLETEEGHFATPGIWWPDDRAWAVATTIEGHSTYVGASRAAIDDLVRSPDLEALEVPHDVPID